MIVHSFPEFEALKIKIDSKRGQMTIHYIKSISPNAIGNILLLHGAKFTSKIWLDLQTVQKLFESDLNVYAIDLPDYGESVITAKGSDSSAFDENLYSIAKKLDIIEKPFILVSPSLSGKYSLPFITSYPQLVAGFISIAPKLPSSSTNPVLSALLEEGIETSIAPIKGKNSTTALFEQKSPSVNILTLYKDFPDHLSPEKESLIKSTLTFPALIVWGSFDSPGKTRSSKLLRIPKSRPLEVVGTGHSCYIDDPATFHSAVIAFSKMVFLRDSTAMDAIPVQVNSTLPISSQLELLSKSAKRNRSKKSKSKVSRT